MLTIRVKKLHPDAKLPTVATPGSACYDVYSVETVELDFRQVYRLKTGLAFELPEGYAMDIRPRSGLASRGVIIVNSPGTLDSDYRGELQIPMITLLRMESIGKGERIAQIRIFETERLDFIEKEELNGTERGEGGFGSTGR